MTQAIPIIAELQQRKDWPTILRNLTDLLDTEGIGGVTTEQIEKHFQDIAKRAKA